MSKFIKEKQFVTIFPYVDVALRIFLCNLASNCLTERSFSTLRRIKNYLRSSMSSERLNSLAVLNIEATLTKSLNYSDVIKTFAAKQARKIKLNHSIGANCEDDDCDGVLNNLKEFLFDELQIETIVEETDCNDQLQTTLVSMPPNNDNIITSGSRVYVSGWIIKKVKKID
ncbi:hypothetical protein QTP88_016099 [Uroleucon formosanum]